MFAKELLLFLSLANMLPSKHIPPAPELTRQQSTREITDIILTWEELERAGWQRFANKRLSLSLQAVPPLNPEQKSHVAGWSCGPDAVTRAVSLVTGRMPFSSGKDYTHFALGVPKGMGTYHDHQHDELMSFNTYGLKQVHSLLWWLGMPQTLQSLLSLANLKTGAPPEWLAQYMNAKAAGIMHGLEFVYYGTDNFADMWQQITSHLDQGDGVIPMIAMGALQWHYLNIAGYHPETGQALVLDFNRLSKWSIQRLQGLMHMGFNAHYLQYEEYAAFFGGSLVNRISTVSDYNAIFVRKKNTK